MPNICEICFRDTEKEEHQDFCPKKPKNMNIEDLFPGLKIKDNQDENLQT